jgi:protocatechuate 3,4-dioxygenase beta subunit
LTVPDSLTVPTGNVDGLLTLKASAVQGPTQVVTISASYGGKTLWAQVWVTPRPSILAGVVTDTRGHPIEQAIVLIDNGDVTGAGHWQLSTRSDGSYATGVLSPGTYDIQVSASGYVPAYANVSVQEGLPTTQANFTLEVRLPTIIEGTVQGADATPLAGAEVLLLQQDDSRRLTATTDSTGGYSMSVDPADYTGGYWIRVTSPGYAEGFRDLILPNGGTLRENFTLEKLGSLTGLITDSGQTTPAPIAKADVQVSVEE